jgi:mismatch-specific thymine-DNA glycosylase
MANSGRYRLEGPTREYEPDVLAKGLDVIFCGISPASTAAEAGHNFSSASNRFWRVLHLAGFTPTQLAPENERRLLDYHCGITAVVRRSTARASDVSLGEFKRARSHRSQNALLRPPLRSVSRKACTVRYAVPAED